MSTIALPRLAARARSLGKAASPTACIAQLVLAPAGRRRAPAAAARHRERLWTRREGAREPIPGRRSWSRESGTACWAAEPAASHPRPLLPSIPTPAPTDEAGSTPPPPAAPPPWLGWALSALTALLASLWRAAAPFPLRKAFWGDPSNPPHPPLHASPRLAALRAAVARGEDRTATLTALGFPPDGRLAAPLDDVPTWRLEALVGRRLSARAARRVRAALALPGSLDRASILSRSPSLYASSADGTASWRAVEDLAASVSSSASSSRGSSEEEGEGESAAGDASPTSSSLSNSTPTPAALAAASLSPPPALTPGELAARCPPGSAYEFQRLEFLGDAVLEIAAREWSLASFPLASEGVLTNATSNLVCSRTLLAVAASPRLRLDRYVAANAHAMIAEKGYLTHWSGLGGAKTLVDAFEALVRRGARGRVEEGGGGGGGGWRCTQ